MGLSTRLWISSSLSLFSTFALSAAPKLRLDQAALGPLSIGAGLNGTPQTVTAYPEGAGGLNLSVTSSASWLAATPAAAASCTLGAGTCVPIRIDLRTSSLARGRYTGILTVNDPGALDAPQTITVTVQMGGGVPDRLELYVAPDGAAETAFVSNSSLTVAPRTDQGGNWLSVSGGGIGSFQFAWNYQVTVRGQGLGEGAYNGSLAVSGSRLSDENRTVPVVMRVTTQPILRPSKDSIALKVAQGSFSAAGAQGLIDYVVLNNAGRGTLAVSGVTLEGVTGDWLAAQMLPNTSLLRAAVKPGALGAGRYTATIKVASNAANGTLSIPVELEVIASPAPVAFYGGAVNNSVAPFAGITTLAKGAIVALYGEHLTPGDPAGLSAGITSLPTQLGGARVLVNGVPAPLFYASHGQINFLLPYETTAGEAEIQVERDGRIGNRIAVQVNEVAPRLLWSRIGDYGIIINPDGSFAMPRISGISSRPVKRGETLVIYLIGAGPTEPPVRSGSLAPMDVLSWCRQSVFVTFGTAGPFAGTDVPVEASFCGLTPGFAGLYQINVIVPDNAPAGAAVPLTASVAGNASNRVTIAIE
jgi:uncharacterized protein (TIGR03437 family)